ncbi:hypothetical protein NL108_017571 [Boleophthalmus pectinirostris]|uniref:uncharacterized protein LOC129409662 n=1 Tax=Boleophthalmus pectinirostris TaxID=150288 RepID=UPI00242CB980|nr:uncharacterized protein LOC129409662 [Boleophthalmus pectinirostris]KAJ0056002.1 hypothetical protein NL108_017571 [Boleophthalmus pectinirostris]
MAQWSAAALLLFYVCRGSLGVDLFEWSQSVQLPVDLQPQGNFLSVRWTRGSEEVHLKRQDGDDLRSQSPRFKGRTQMKPDALQTGDLTLVLTNPTSDDVGRYTCVARLNSAEVQSVTVDLRFKGEEKSVEVNTTVSLPFHMGTLRSGVRVRWTWEPEEPEGSQGSQGSQEVHLRVGDRDDLSNQSPHFKGRTQMKPDALKTGDLSLVLNNTSDTDTGTYTCSVTEEQHRTRTHNSETEHQRE